AALSKALCLSAISGLQAWLATPFPSACLVAEQAIARFLAERSVPPQQSVPLGCEYDPSRTAARTDQRRSRRIAIQPAGRHGNGQYGASCDNTNKVDPLEDDHSPDCRELTVVHSRALR